MKKSVEPNPFDMPPSSYPKRSEPPEQTRDDYGEKLRQPALTTEIKPKNPKLLENTPILGSKEEINLFNEPKTQSPQKHMNPTKPTESSTAKSIPSKFGLMEFLGRLFRALMRRFP